MSRYHYMLKCEVCENANVRYDIDKKHDWSVFLQSIRTIIKEGFTFTYCPSSKCVKKVTRQTLMYFESREDNIHDNNNNGSHVGTSDKEETGE